MIIRDTYATGGGNGVNSFTITLSTNYSDEIILVGQCQSNNAAAVSSISSTNLGTFTKIDGNTKGGNGTMDFYRAYASAVLTSEVITVSYSGGVFPQCSGFAVDYYSLLTTGSQAANAINVEATTGSGGTAVSQAITTTKPNVLCLACIGTGSESATTTPGTGSVVIGTAATSGGGSALTELLENVQPTGNPQVVTLSATLSGSAAFGIVAIGLTPMLKNFKLTNNLRPRVFAPGLAR